MQIMRFTSETFRMHCAFRKKSRAGKWMFYIMKGSTCCSVRAKGPRFNAFAFKLSFKCSTYTLTNSYEPQLHINDTHN